MSNKKSTIFLVDDTATILAVGKAILGNLYRVVTMDSGERLFKALEKITPDLILLDLEMPNMSGYDVISRLKDNPQTAHIPVIFLTFINDADYKRKGFDLGAVDYINKPISPPHLLKRVEECLAMEPLKAQQVDNSQNTEEMA